MPSIAKQASDILFLCTQYKANLALAIKNQSTEDILKACVSPHIIIAENRVQEAESRKEFLASLPQKKHFIGTLQKNKIRKALHMFSCIESVHSLELLQEIDRIAEEEKMTPEVFLQINISEDPKKSGFSIETLTTALVAIKRHPLKAVRITGIFTILQNNLQGKEILFFYQSMHKIFKTLQNILGKDFQHLSMGMSQDYQLALMCGATIIRIGSAIFGERTK